ncbi:(Fe-S)-binding protein [Naasia aerilata]|uniref:Cysteine-rich domain-containing protein n=1 Tax=Naasia aerilata TaxID=1162966 RepID=A0ABM8GH69_9MICO|nr:(Fe-S)-binding protein [Naasia aerilata]BDZ47483.1 hypothetical protein GCM10025866_33920 [Naasia aerilata]
MTVRVAESLARATRNGELPVVCDASSCTEGLELLCRAADLNQVRIVDSVAFTLETLLPRLPRPERLSRLILHPTCSSERLGLSDAMRSLAAAVAEEVVVPDDWSCCGFAGDRGMLHPELTASATGPEAREVRALSAEAHASANRTCEMGLSRATGADYRHLLEILDDLLGSSTS